MIKRLLFILLCVITVLVSVPYAQAAAAEVHIINGDRTVFLAPLGKLTYDGTNYVSFRDINDAFDALGTSGGVVIALGTFDMSKFTDSEDRGAVTIRGAGSKMSETVLNYPSGCEKVTFLADTYLRNLILKTEPDVPIYSSGDVLDIGSSVECSFYESYVQDGDNIFTYSAPFVVATGNTYGSGAGLITLSGGHYKAVAGGSVGGNASSKTNILINGGIYEGIYGGNFSCDGLFASTSNIEIKDGNIKTLVTGNESGTFAGNANIIVSGGTIDSLILGSVGGNFNGNINITVNGGTISSLKLAPEITNGNLVLRLYKETAADYDFSGSEAFSGKKIFIVKNDDCKRVLEKGSYDYLITEKDTTVTPVYDGTEFLGFKVYDTVGIVPLKVFANGKEIMAKDGIFNLPTGEVEVSCEPLDAIVINKNASLVQGYEDGSFRPQNNMTIAEAITLLARIITSDLSVLSSHATTDIIDVGTDDWYYGQIALFDTLGFIPDKMTGKFNTIGPHIPITRAQFCELSYKVLSLIYSDDEVVGTKRFSDVSDDNVYADSIGKLGYYGVVGGYEDGTFRPDNNITRAEVVTIVNRMLGRTNVGGAAGNVFYDTVDHWASSEIVTACNPSVIDGMVVWTLDEDIRDGDFTILEGNVTVGDQIKNLYNSYTTGPVSANDVIVGIDKISKWQIDNIVNAPSEYQAERRTYYISNNGNDINDGLSPETAWATLTKLKNTMLLPGDVVLFERGGVFRGDVICMSGVTYSAYGNGAKPIISGSYENYADPAIWIETDVPNVYKLQRNVYNVGVIVFNDSAELGNYNELVGALRVVGLDGFTSYRDLKEDLTFASDLYKRELYLYSAYGNPGERFDSIEIGQYHHLMSVDKVQDVIIDNIHIRHTGGHGFTGGNLKNVTVRNCIADYMGGSILHGYGPTNTVRVGNSIQVYGGCDGWYAYNNWCYQIYDTGVTHQYNAPHGKEDCFMDNVKYIGNVFEYCHWAIEWYNYDYAATQQHFYNTYIADNICVLTGYGWGSRHRPSGAATMVSWGLTKYTKNFVTENNIFDRSLGDIFYLEGAGNKLLELKNNIYVQNFDGSLGFLYGRRYAVGEDIASDMYRLLNDSTAVFIFNEDTEIVNYKPNIR